MLVDPLTKGLPPKSTWVLWEAYEMRPRTKQVKRKQRVTFKLRSLKYKVEIKGENVSIDLHRLGPTTESGP